MVLLFRIQFSWMISRFLLSDTLLETVLVYQMIQLLSCSGFYLVPTLFCFFNFGVLQMIDTSQCANLVGINVLYSNALAHLLLFGKKKKQSLKNLEYFKNHFKLYLGSKQYLRTKGQVNFFRDGYASTNPLGTIPIAACFVPFLQSKIKVY